ncbi:hypothetical protein [Paenibacillus bovis]|uniref:Uncharacterized protein n=1 Tax=Paenibacillus bovis TaxID=1616788 RepID=A0A172ZEQ1_9BACL|nr:hypothetical protein [Paenibacillus bovis]ANF96121.1 hypothetical protein AR543_09000 [Paenibacillus bovis]
MLTITRQLIMEMEQNTRRESVWYETMLHMIIKYGNIEDAHALYQCFIAHPKDWDYIMLLEGVCKLGDRELGLALYQWAFTEGRLRDELSEDILTACGYLGVQEAVSSLLHYALDSKSWDLQNGACLGLLQLQLDDKEAAILRKAIESTMGQSLFNEFLPALSSQVADATLIPKLYHWGEQQASIDCNAGLVLGIALYGPAYHEWVRRILWSPYWEAHDTGTGTCVWMYRAMNHVGLTFADLIDDVRHTLTDTEDRQRMEYQLDVLHQMVCEKLRYRGLSLSVLQPNQETVEEIYHALYHWSTPDYDDSIIGLIIKRLGMDYRELQNFYNLRTRLEMRIAHDMETAYLWSQYKQA